MSCRRTQRKPMTKAQTKKTYSRKLVQPLSIVPDGARVISRNSSRMTVNPPNQRVVFPNLVLGRRTRLSHAFISVESGSLGAIKQLLVVSVSGQLSELNVLASPGSDNGPLATSHCSDLRIEIEKRCH